MVKDCMFHCSPDDLDVPDHWEKKCRGNPNVITKPEICVVCKKPIKNHSEKEKNDCWWNHCLL